MKVINSVVVVRMYCSSMKDETTDDLWVHGAASWVKLREYFYCKWRVLDY